jgi:hypothetical protein
MDRREPIDDGLKHPTATKRGLTVLTTKSNLAECFDEGGVMDRRQLLFGATALFARSHIVEITKW